jgi:predicted NBD/HSP70 family sugar kinase
MRRGNLSALLRIVHERGAVTRAELTAVTGLNRTTVGDLVAELVELGFVVEGAPTMTFRVGRPSPTVMVDDAPVAITVAPGPDGVEVAIVGLGGRVLRRARTDLDRSPDPEQTAAHARRLVGRMRRGALAGKNIVGAGIAIPGLVRSDGLVRRSTLLGWDEDVPIADLIGEQLDLPAFAGGDANLGAVAEWRFGAGRGLRNLVYLHGGSHGIGGGAIVDGRPLEGKSGYAAAGLGHAVSELAEPVTSEPLAGAVARLVDVFDPQAVILGGTLADVLSAAPTEFAALVSKHALPDLSAGVSLLEAKVDVDGTALGAAELAFEGLLRDPVAFASSVS